MSTINQHANQGDAILLDAIEHIDQQLNELNGLKASLVALLSSKNNQGLDASKEDNRVKLGHKKPHKSTTVDDIIYFLRMQNTLVKRGDIENHLGVKVLNSLRGAVERGKVASVKFDGNQHQTYYILPQYLVNGRVPITVLPENVDYQTYEVKLGSKTLSNGIPLSLQKRNQAVVDKFSKDE